MPRAKQQEVNVTELDEDGRKRWDFVVQDEEYGKLVCSYYPNALFQNLEDFFAEAISTIGETGGKTVNLNHIYLCEEEARRLLKEKVEENIRDAMQGLVHEIRLQVLRNLNGWYFFLDNFDPTEQAEDIRKFYSERATERMSARPGRLPDRAVFLREVNAAYLAAAKKANRSAMLIAKRHMTSNGRETSSRLWRLPKTRKSVRLVSWKVNERRWEVFGRVTLSALAREMYGGRGISQSVLTRQMKRYAVTIEDLEKVYDEERNNAERRGLNFDLY
ncbi:MAG: hypothetical protein H0W76_23770 [Pyrinomonadaceae bacterium]|nr:hypothetical protein [Pyrinomonadaceae bacterium]